MDRTHVRVCHLTSYLLARRAELAPVSYPVARPSPAPALRIDRIASGGSSTAPTWTIHSRRVPSTPQHPHLVWRDADGGALRPPWRQPRVHLCRNRVAARAARG